MTTPRMQMTTSPSHFRGCLLGGAVGDALGAAIEFKSRDMIIAKHGESGLTDYIRAYGRIAAITDDTQMTLFTAEGLLCAMVRDGIQDRSHATRAVAYSYLRWLQTQGHPSHIDVRTDGWLYGFQDLHHSRAPGITCLNALRCMQSVGQLAENDSKGCGGIMRVAPVGLIFATDKEIQLERVFNLAVDVAAITHGHPTGQLAAGFFAALIPLLVNGTTLTKAIDMVRPILLTHNHCQETLYAIDSAIELANGNLPAPQAITRLGEGWIAEEALAISLYCALVAEDFAQGVILAVNHDGDSDSTGAITGNLLGAALGEFAIPDHWLEPLELRNVISEIAEDLYHCHEWYCDVESMNETAKHIVQKYPS